MSNSPLVTKTSRSRTPPLSHLLSTQSSALIKTFPKRMIKPIRDNKLLRKIKQREKTVLNDISPDTALRITRLCILPLLTRNSNEKQHKPKLSQLLGKSIHKANRELNTHLQTYKEVCIEKTNIMSEIQRYKDAINNALLMKHLLKRKREAKAAPESFQAPETNGSVSNELTTVKNNNKILSQKCTVNRLENIFNQFSSLLLGERLLALHNTHSLLFDREYLEGRFEEDSELKQRYTEEVYEVIKRKEKKSLRIGMENQSYSESTRNLSSSCLYLIKDFQLMRQKFYERVDKFNKDLKDTDKEKRLILEKSLEIQEKLEKFKIDYEKLTQSASHFVESHPGLFNGEDRACVNCSKLFIEDSNFNWSCNWHPGLFENGMYWCCGQTDKFARGCQSSKHVPKDETQVIGQKVSAVSCGSCHQVGHTYKDCPKDPNIHTHSNSFEELQRVKSLCRVKVMSQKSFRNPRSEEVKIRLNSFKLVKPHFADVKAIKNRMKFSPERNRVKLYNTFTN